MISRGFRAGSSWRRQVGIEPAAVVFVCVARFHPRRTTSSWSAPSLTWPPNAVMPCWCWQATGPTRQSIESEVGRLGFASQVRFLGATGDVVSVLQGSDVFVLASRWEGHPLLILEAMAVGLPIIAPCVGGIGEIVSSGVNGILVDGGDEADASGSNQAPLRIPRRSDANSAAARERSRWNPSVSKP